MIDAKDALTLTLPEARGAVGIMAAERNVEASFLSPGTQGARC